MGETTSTSPTYATELRRGFQDEANTFVPTAGQLVLDPSEYEGWSCSAYDANTDAKSDWMLQLSTLAPGVLIRGGGKKNFTTYTAKPNFWFSPKETSVPPTAVNYVRAYRLDGQPSQASGDSDTFRLVVEHVLIGAQAYVTRPTYDPVTGVKLPADASVTSAVAAYSICEPKKKPAE